MLARDARQQRAEHLAKLTALLYESAFNVVTPGDADLAFKKALMIEERVAAWVETGR